MKKDLLEYINGQKNAIRDEFIVSRESTGSAELIHIQHPEMDRELYTLWHSSNKKKSTEKPKNTGGKKPYTMLMKGSTSKLSIEAAGLFCKIIDGYMEWNTGKVIYKDRSMTQADMRVLFKVAQRKLKQALAELASGEIIVYDSSARAYYVDYNAAKRGGKSK